MIHQSISAQQIEIEIPVSIPCRDVAAESKGGFLRTIGTAFAESESLALKKAIFNARNEQSQQLQSFVSAATQQQKKTTGISDIESIEQTFSSQITIAVDQCLAGISVICQVTEPLTSGQYKATVIAELNTNEFLGTMKEVYGTDTLRFNTLKARLLISD